LFGSPSCSPIADAAEHGIGLLWLKILVSFAAVAATLSVLLTTQIGVSRVSFAMARDGSIPRFLAKVHHKFHTPYLAIIVTGAATAILPFIGGLRQMANVINFGSLFVYSIVNLSAVSLMKKKYLDKTLPYRIVSGRIRILRDANVLLGMAILDHRNCLGHHSTTVLHDS